ncbi:hypothetical protein PTKIN_Ptkin01aG0378400 [Pterospermum kingtungense]
MDIIFISYQQFWCPSPVFKAVVSFQKHFLALDSDIIVTSLPKCGTTWLKALTFSIVNRNQFAKEENPLLSLGPHQLVRASEYDLYLNNPFPDLENTICAYNQPRLFPPTLLMLLCHLPLQNPKLRLSTYVEIQWMCSSLLGLSLTSFEPVKYVRPAPLVFSGFDKVKFHWLFFLWVS